MDHLAQSPQSSIPPGMAAPSSVAPTHPNLLAQGCSDTLPPSHPPHDVTATRSFSRPHPVLPSAPSMFPADQTFGHPLPRISGPNCLRLGYTNVAGFPVDALNNSKAMELRAFFAHHQIDIFAGCESNINWKKMPFHASLHEWFRSPEAFRCSFAHIIHDNFGRRQFGGTFLLGFGPITDSIVSSGSDTSGLGRWSWFCLQGRTQQSLRMVSIYRLCMSERAKLKSVYAQHLRYLESQNDSTCPRLAFLRDLKLACQDWRAAGDRLLIVGDFNGDVRGPELQEFFPCSRCVRFS